MAGEGQSSGIMALCVSLTDPLSGHHNSLLAGTHQPPFKGPPPPPFPELIISQSTTRLHLPVLFFISPWTFGLGERSWGFCLLKPQLNRYDSSDNESLTRCNVMLMIVREVVLLGLHTLTWLSQYYIIFASLNSHSQCQTFLS